MSTPVATHPMRWEADLERRVAWFLRLLDQRARPAKEPNACPLPRLHRPATGTHPRPGTTRLALLVATATGVVANGGTLDHGPAPTPTTTPSPGPADPPDDGPGGGSEVPEPAPTPEPEPEPEPATVEVPELSGITRAGAEQILAGDDLKARIRYRSTDQYPAGTVISQSPKTGALVLPDTTVSLVVAKPPTPPPSTAPPPSTTPAPSCDPSYPDVCLDPAVEDYDCAGGSGNGPGYVEGPIRVLPPDPFDLDQEGDGVGCENG